MECDNMRKILIVLMAAVLIAGCTGQPNPPTTTGTGLAITSFTADTDSQMSGRDVRLFLDVSNNGEATVSKGNTLIYLNGPIGDGLLQWKMPNNGVQYATLDRDLTPYDALKDIPAGSASIKWTLEAPEMDPGQQKTDTFTARAYYDYETKVAGDIVAYSEAESTAAKQKGETLETAQFTTTKGPLSVSVRAIPDPVIVVDNSGETMTLELVIENTGGGTVYKVNTVKSGEPTTVSNIGYNELNKINVVVNAVDPDNNNNIATNCGGEQELIGGKPTTITCDINVKMPPSKKSYPIKVSLDYGYYIDSPIQLTAIGRKV